MNRTLGIAGIVVTGVLAGCGQPLPGVKPAAPTPTQNSTAQGSTAESPAPQPSPTPASSTASPVTTTPAASVTPATSPTAEPSATTTPGAAGQVNLPDQVDTFMKVEGRTEGDLRIGAYYSDKLKTVVEARTTSGKSAKDLLATQGVTDPAAVGRAWCGGTQDNLCAQDKGGVAVLLSSKELPGSMLSDLTTKFLAAMGKN